MLLLLRQAFCSWMEPDEPIKPSAFLEKNSLTVRYINCTVKHPQLLRHAVPPQRSSSLPTFLRGGAVTRRSLYHHLPSRSHHRALQNPPHLRARRHKTLNFVSL